MFRTPPPRTWQQQQQSVDSPSETDIKLRELASMASIAVAADSPPRSSLSSEGANSPSGTPFAAINQPWRPSVPPLPVPASSTAPTTAPTKRAGPFAESTLSPVPTPPCTCYARLEPGSPDPHAPSVKYIGVRVRGRSRWVAEIKDNNHGVRKWLGTFACPVQAAQAFDAAARAIRGTKTKSNFKPGHPNYIAESLESGPPGLSAGVRPQPRWDSPLEKHINTSVPQPHPSPPGRDARDITDHGSAGNNIPASRPGKRQKVSASIAAVSAAKLPATQAMVPITNPPANAALPAQVFPQRASSIPSRGAPTLPAQGASAMPPPIASRHHGLSSALAGRVCPPPSADERIVHFEARQIASAVERAMLCELAAPPATGSSRAKQEVEVWGEIPAAVKAAHMDPVHSPVRDLGYKASHAIELANLKGTNQPSHQHIEQQFHQQQPMLKLEEWQHQQRQQQLLQQAAQSVLRLDQSTAQMVDCGSLWAPCRQLVDTAAAVSDFAVALGSPSQMEVQLRNKARLGKQSSPDLSRLLSLHANGSNDAKGANSSDLASGIVPFCGRGASAARPAGDIATALSACGLSVASLMPVSDGRLTAEEFGDMRRRHGWKVVRREDLEEIPTVARDMLLGRVVKESSFLAL